MRPTGCLTVAALEVGFVVLVVAGKPLDMALALERENMGGDAVEEPAVMADDEDAAGKRL